MSVGAFFVALLSQDFLDATAERERTGFAAFLVAIRRGAAGGGGQLDAELHGAQRGAGAGLPADGAAAAEGGGGLLDQARLGGGGGGRGREGGAGEGGAGEGESGGEGKGEEGGEGEGAWSKGFGCRQGYPCQEYPFFMSYSMSLS